MQLVEITNRQRLSVLSAPFVFCVGFPGTLHIPHEALVSVCGGLVCLPL